MSNVGFVFVVGFRKSGKSFKNGGWEREEKGRYCGRDIEGI